jgi:hypothetical protein
MRSTWVVSAGIAAIAVPLLVASQSGSTCLLHSSEPGSYTATDCITCHQNGTATSIAFTHPVDLDYASRQIAKPDSLRPAADVVAMGVPLPSGMLRCATCHTDKSPWRHYIRLPNGATARTHVTPDQPESQPAQPGDEITPTPLCKACHAF